MRVRGISASLCAAAVAVCGFPQPALACPMCSQSLASALDSAIPRAYMYSILFMLFMLALIFTCFAVGIYRVVQRRDAAQVARFRNSGVFAEAQPEVVAELDFANRR